MFGIVCNNIGILTPQRMPVRILCPECIQIHSLLLEECVSNTLKGSMNWNLHAMPRKLQKKLEHDSHNLHMVL